MPACAVVHWDVRLALGYGLGARWRSRLGRSASTSPTANGRAASSCISRWPFRSDMRRLAYLALIVSSAVVGLGRLAGWQRARPADSRPPGRHGHRRPAAHRTGQRPPAQPARHRHPALAGAESTRRRHGIHLDWSPADLLRGRLQVAALDIATLRIDQPPSDAPATLPADLQLPLAVAIERLSTERSGLQQPTTFALLQQLRQPPGQRWPPTPSTTCNWRAVSARRTGPASTAWPFPLAAARACTVANPRQRPLDRVGDGQSPARPHRPGHHLHPGHRGPWRGRTDPLRGRPFRQRRLPDTSIRPAGGPAPGPAHLVADIAPKRTASIGSFS